jgi:hypothetical protein
VVALIGGCQEAAPNLEVVMAETFPHGYALLIGVGQSAYLPWSLPVTVQDTRAIRSVLADPGLCAYPEGHIRLLHDEQATRAAIHEGLDWLARQVAAGPHATAVVCFSGHGWLEGATGRYYLIPHDIEPHCISGSAISAEAFIEALRRVEAGRLLVIIDACHAGGMATAHGETAAVRLPAGLAPVSPPKEITDELKQGAGRAAFTSSHGHQSSWVRPDGTLSVYTYHLIEALQGANNRPGDTTVKLSNLMNHLGQSVPESARKLRNAEQVPFFDTAAEDFAVALLRGGKGLPAGGWPSVEKESRVMIGRVVQAIGERSIVIGGNVSGGVIIAGDRNQLKRGQDREVADRQGRSAAENDPSALIGTTPMVTQGPHPAVPKAFVSYSWDDEAHKEWVKLLATRLRADGVAVTLDRWHAAPGDRIPVFMERAVRESDFVIAVCTPKFKERSDGRGGGVGYEGDIMTAYALTGGGERKFIPVLRRGGWIEAAPTWLLGRAHIDLSGDPYSESEYGELLQTLHGAREAAPPIGDRPHFERSNESGADSD